MFLRQHFMVPDDFQSIQQALDALPQNGGSVEIRPGLYQENLRWSKPGPLYLQGCNVPGPCWVSPPLCCIQAAEGTVFQAGSDTEIMDPSVYIENIAFANANGGSCTYGVYARRMRCLTLRDVQFLNFQPAGVALFLDGTGGWHEWAHLDNVNWGNCSQPLVTLNATHTKIFGGLMTNVTTMTKTVGIQTTGQSDTLRIFGLAIDEFEQGIVLSGATEEDTMIEGLRFEYHLDQHPSGVKATGVVVDTTGNKVEGSFWGSQTAISFAPTSGGCRYLALGSGNTVVDKGVKNAAI